MRDAFINRLFHLAERDPRIFLVTADLGFRIFDAFIERFPERFLNVGVSEQNMTGVATGLALEGRVVFTYSIGNFPTLRCLEQLRNDACYHRAKVKVVAVGGGFSYGTLGFSHHATEDLSVLRSLPYLSVLAPGDDWEVEEATTALARTDGTFYLRLERSSAPCARVGTAEPFRLGRARLMREGKDVTLISTGGLLGNALGAAELVARRGLRCRVLSMHTVKPLDQDAVLRAARETGGIVTVEENALEGGLGGAVAEVCLDNGVLPEVFVRMGIRGEVAATGDQAYLRHVHGLSAQAIAEEVLSARLKSRARG